jgi:hypothetical protein
VLFSSIPGTYDRGWAHKTAPTLDQRAGLLSFALAGWWIASSTLHGSDFILYQVETGAEVFMNF